MARQGVPTPYVLRLDPEKIDWREPLVSIRKKLAYHLGGRSFTGVAEFTKTGELHIHGHIEARDAGERKEIEAALHKVAKGWRKGRAKARAVWTADDARVDGWTCYSTKAVDETKAEFDRRRRKLQVNSKRSPVITICSDDIRGAAKELYEEHRRRLGARRFSVERLVADGVSEALGAPLVEEETNEPPTPTPARKPLPTASQPMALESPSTFFPSLPEGAVPTDEMIMAVVENLLNG
jgi:hypothetical protein